MFTRQEGICYLNVMSFDFGSVVTINYNYQHDSGIVHHAISRMQLLYRHMLKLCYLKELDLF